jgi:hypothetical protein
VAGEEVTMLRRIFAVLAVLALASSASAGGLQLLDAGGAPVGVAKVNLSKGAVALKTTGLGVLPADVDTGTEQFTAYLYKAYLGSSTDPAVEIFLGDLYPNAKGKAAVKAKLKGNLDGFGFDQIVVVAFSEDATQSFDVGTAALSQ